MPQRSFCEMFCRVDIHLCTLVKYHAKGILMYLPVHIAFLQCFLNAQMCIVNVEGKDPSELKELNSAANIIRAHCSVPGAQLMKV